MSAPRVITGDSVVRDVIGKFNFRSVVGVEKYGVTLEREDLNTEQWLIHLQEELMDATLYIEKLLRQVRSANLRMSSQTPAPAQADGQEGES